MNKMNNQPTFDLNTFLKSIQSRPVYIGVRLQQGETLYGSLYWPLLGDISKDLMGLGRQQIVLETAFRSDREFLYLFTVDVGIGVYQIKVPRNEIDSIFVIPEFESIVIESPDHPRVKTHGLIGTFKTDMYRLMLDHTTKKVKQLDLKYRKVVDAKYLDSLPHPATFPVWLTVKPKGLFPIYFDQDYFGNRLQWSVLNGARSSVKELVEINDYMPETVTSGIISFFEPPSKLIIEGAEWQLCAVTPDYVSSGELKDQTDWLLAALKTRWLLNAMEVMERIEEPYLILGDLLQVAVEMLGYGTKQNLLKIRAAAHLPETVKSDKLKDPSKDMILTGIIKENVRKDETVIKIIFLASDPSDASRLRLGEELREIQEKVQLARMRDHFVLHQRMSVRPEDISQALLDIKPQIVHFSGHGTTTGALCFEDKLGNIRPIQPDALSALFDLFSDHVNCVILNACYSETQANAIAEHINHVVGMVQAIGDRAAIAFTVGFYQALGAGRSIEDAYKLGCVQIRLQGIPEHLTPVLIKKSELTS